MLRAFFKIRGGRFWRLFVALSPALLIAKGGGGGGGGKGGGGGGRGGFGGWMGGGMGGFGGYAKPKDTYDPKKLQEESDKKVKKFVEDGFAALRAGDTGSALELFSDALVLNPNSGLAHFGLGLTKAGQGSIHAGAG